MEAIQRILFIGLGMCLVHMTTCQIVHGPTADIHDYARTLATSDELSTSHRLLATSVASAFRRLDDVSDLVDLSQLPKRSTCLSDVEHILAAVADHANWPKAQWALQMLDAIAKPPSGILDLSFLWIGRFSECRKVNVLLPRDAVDVGGLAHQMTGQYCMVTIGSNSTKQHEIIPGINSTADFQLRVAMCMPSTCSPEEVLAFVATVASNIANATNITFPFKVEKVGCQPESIKFDAKAIAALILCSVVLLMCILGTVYDVCVHQQTLQGIARIEEEMSRSHSATVPSNEYSPLLSSPSVKERTVASQASYNRQLSKWRRALLAFSVYTNGAKILHAKHSPGSLQCLQGIRFLSMSWVILGHTMFFVITFIDNIGAFSHVVSRWSFQIIVNGTYSVDSFFVLSGFLVSYLFLKEMKKRGRVNLPLFYFHRFWRLTPPYMLVIMFDVALFRYIGSGPLWPTADGGNEPNCASNWWTNLLYINNFVNPDKMCMGWSWYLSNDMQFFLVSPLILIPLYKSTKIGLAILFTCLAASLTTTGIISDQYNLPAALFEGGIGSKESFDQLYIKPYCRIGPYLVGMAAGFLLYKTDCRIRMHKGLAILGWCTAAACNLAVVYGLHSIFNGANLSQATINFYNTSARTAWSLGLAWVMVACLTGNGGYINTILSWNGFIPASRLTYCTYLVHPIVILWYYQSREEMMHYQDITMTIHYLGFLLLAFSIAFVVSLAFESPMMGLEKIFLPSHEKKKDPHDRHVQEVH